MHVDTSELTEARLSESDSDINIEAVSGIKAIVLDALCFLVEKADEKFVAV